MWPTPAWWVWCGLALVRSRSPRVICPDTTLRIPARASTSSRCPLPSTPATPTISPARTESVKPLTAPRSRSSLTCRSVIVSTVSAGVASALSIDSTTSRPTIIVASLRASVVGGLDLADDGALAQHVDPVGHREHLAQLVRDEDDRRAGGRELLHDAEQLVGLLRRQHRGRLVEDEQVDLARERLEDLDALLGADRQVLDLGVGVDRQAVLGRQRAHHLAGAGDVEPPTRLGGLVARASCSRPRSSPAPAGSAGAPCRCRARWRRAGP